MRNERNNDDWTESIKRRVEFQLRFLIQHLDDIPEKTATWVEILDDAYEKYHKLTPRQVKVLDNIWDEFDNRN